MTGSGVGVTGSGVGVAGSNVGVTTTLGVKTGVLVGIAVGDVGTIVKGTSSVAAGVLTSVVGVGEILGTIVGNEGITTGAVGVATTTVGVVVATPAPRPALMRGAAKIVATPRQYIIVITTNTTSRIAFSVPEGAIFSLYHRHIRSCPPPAPWPTPYQSDGPASQLRLTPTRNPVRDGS